MSDLIVGTPNRADVFNEDRLHGHRQGAWNATTMNGRKRRKEDERAQMLEAVTGGLKETIDDLRTSRVLPPGSAS